MFVRGSVIFKLVASCAPVNINKVVPLSEKKTAGGRVLRDSLRSHPTIP